MTSIKFHLISFAPQKNCVYPTLEDKKFIRIEAPVSLPVRLFYQPLAEVDG